MAVLDSMLLNLETDQKIVINSQISIRLIDICQLTLNKEKQNEKQFIW